jgi:hypothetical protein
MNKPLEEKELKKREEQVKVEKRKLDLEQTELDIKRQRLGLEEQSIALGRQELELESRKSEAVAKHHTFESKKTKAVVKQGTLEFCQEVMAELRKPRNWQVNQYFMEPVNPVALGIPTYFTFIKNPMDLTTVQHKLDAKKYNTTGEFEQDVRLIVGNAFKFYNRYELMHKSARDLENLFNKLWNTSVEVTVQPAKDKKANATVSSHSHRTASTTQNET